MSTAYLWSRTARPAAQHSGGRSSRRLNHGGDRQANAALHRIVFTRLRHDPRTQAYYERRNQEGKTRREIIRCLERYAAREVFNLVRTVSTDPRYRGVCDRTGDAEPPLARLHLAGLRDVRGHGPLADWKETAAPGRSSKARPTLGRRKGWCAGPTEPGKVFVMFFQTPIYE
ncbi:transposase [Streptomyces sp. NPDC050485]|uniref:transposase n=1 Tax=Streptomyces sp. NPDC050485 TaxID=3365617 RepID=UPI00378BE08B